MLRALRRALPGVPMLYAADSAWAPYGERSDGEIAARSAQVAQALIDAGAQALVVACNTATAHAVAELRSRWPERVIVGVEPGLKPALAVTRNGRVGVMATDATLRSTRFGELLQRVLEQAQREQQRSLHVHLQPCTGLAGAIERGDLGCADLARQVEHWCALLREAEVDTVVLGCTHYPFVAPLISRALGPDVRLIDTAEAVARQAALRWHAADAGAAQLADTALPAAEPKPASASAPIPAAAVSLPASAANSAGPALQCAVAAPVRYLGSGELSGLRRAVTHWLNEADPELAPLGC